MKLYIYMYIYIESTNKVLCFTNIGTSYKDTMESITTKSV